jgi:hypothetical protein
LKQIGLAHLQYAQDHDEKFVIIQPQPPSTTTLAWDRTIEAYMEMKVNNAWDSPMVFRCPSDTSVTGSRVRSYAMIDVSGGGVGRQSIGTIVTGCHQSQISSSATTLLLAERHGGAFDNQSEQAWGAQVFLTAPVPVVMALKTADIGTLRIAPASISRAGTTCSLIAM